MSLRSVVKGEALSFIGQEAAIRRPSRQTLFARHRVIIVIVFRRRQQQQTPSNLQGENKTPPKMQDHEEAGNVAAADLGVRWEAKPFGIYCTYGLLCLQWSTTVLLIDIERNYQFASESNCGHSRKCRYRSRMSLSGNRSSSDFLRSATTAILLSVSQHHRSMQFVIAAERD